MMDVVVLGQVGRDLVLRIGGLPEAGGAVAATERHELLGGKGANQAVALAQLGVPVALVGVVGDDEPGAMARAEAAADGIDVSAVLRRPGATTALMVDLVEDGGARRLVEDVPPEVLLTSADVDAVAALVARCRLLSIQLQQPGEAVRAALDRAPSTAVVVTDGAPADDATRAAVLARADVIRADAEEAALWAGRTVADGEDAHAAAAALLAQGPGLVALTAGGDGDLVAWRAGSPRAVGAPRSGPAPVRGDGAVLVPRLGGPPVDPTGAGDAYVAALGAALLGGAAPAEAAWAGSAAAALTVAHAGGRPGLDPAAIGAVVSRHRST